jgi:hypothetical protein
MQKTCDPLSVLEKNLTGIDIDICYCVLVIRVTIISSRIVVVSFDAAPFCPCHRPTPKKTLELATQHGLLHKIRGRGTIIRTSLYADDAAIFVDPKKEDI